MDIILDTNVLVSDYQLKSAKFSSLIDHLKKTGGSFVLLQAVRAELLAVYKRDLSSRLEKARAACSSLAMLVSNRELSPSVNIDKELELLTRRLLNLKTKVPVISYSGAVETAEIVRRGACRIPPANEKGEELRDVIVWLIALDYATSTKRKTAFITADKGFWAGNSLKDQLKEDLTKTQGLLEVYTDIEAFISKNNVKSAPVDREWLAKYVGTKELRELTLKHLRTQLQADFYSFTFEISLDSLQITRGIAYEVSPESTFVEFQCDFGASLKTAPSSIQSVSTSSLGLWDSSSIAGIATYPLSNNNSVQGSLGGFFQPASGVTIFNPSSTISQVTTNSSPLSYASYGGIYGASTISGLQPTLVSFSPRTPPGTIAGTTYFTMRVLNDKMHSVDLDRVFYEEGERKANNT